MKIFFLTIAFMALPISQALAHEGGKIAEGSVESGWQGPTFAVLVIIISIVIARIINKKQRS